MLVATYVSLSNDAIKIMDQPHHTFRKKKDQLHIWSERVFVPTLIKILVN
jgi:hypothetical protein